MAVTPASDGGAGSAQAPTTLDEWLGDPSQAPGDGSPFSAVADDGDHSDRDDQDDDVHTDRIGKPPVGQFADSGDEVDTEELPRDDDDGDDREAPKSTGRDDDAGGGHWKFHWGGEQQEGPREKRLSPPNEGAAEAIRDDVEKTDKARADEIDEAHDANLQANGLRELEEQELMRRQEEARRLAQQQQQQPAAAQPRQASTSDEDEQEQPAAEDPRRQRKSTPLSAPALVGATAEEPEGESEQTAEATADADDDSPRPVRREEVTTAKIGVPDEIKALRQQKRAAESKGDDDQRPTSGDEIFGEGGDDSQAVDPLAPTAEGLAAPSDAELAAGQPDADAPDQGREQSESELEEEQVEETQEKADEDLQEAQSREDELIDDGAEAGEEAAKQPVDDELYPAFDEKAFEATQDYPPPEELDLDSEALVERHAEDKRVVTTEYDLSQTPSRRPAMPGDQENTPVTVPEEGQRAQQVDTDEDLGLVDTAPMKADAPTSDNDSTPDDDDDEAPEETAAPVDDQDEEAVQEGVDEEEDEQDDEAVPKDVDEEEADEQVEEETAAEQDDEQVEAVDEDEVAEEEADQDEELDEEEEVDEEIEVEEEDEQVGAVDEEEAAEKDDDEDKSAVVESDSEASFFEAGDEIHDFDEHFEQDLAGASNRGNKLVIIAAFAALVAMLLAAITIFSGDKEETGQSEEQEVAMAEPAEPEPAPEEPAPEPEPEPAEEAVEEEADPLAEAAEEAEVVGENMGIDIGFDAYDLAEMIDAAEANEEIADGEIDEAGDDELAAADAETSAEPEEEQAPAPTGPSVSEQIQELRGLVANEQTDEAVALGAELASRASNNGQAAFLYGQAASDNGNYDLAIAQLTRAESLGITSADLYLELATVYHIAGRRDDAQQSYEQFQSMGTEPTTARASQLKDFLSRQY